MDDSTTEPPDTREDESADERVDRRRERQQQQASEAASALGQPGRPLNRQSPFFVGFVGAIGVLFAWGLLHVVTQLSSVLLLIVVALFLALGLDPVVQWLQARGLRRGYAAGRSSWA